MKTPMQELIDYTTDLLHTFDSEERVAMAVLDYLKTNKKAMLEKEEEVINNAYSDGVDNGRCLYECKDYYKETFKTKEND